MEPNHYMDEKTLVLDHMLLSLQCDEPSFTVPAAFGGYSATAVGSGALQITMNVRKLTFAPGYRVLRDGCLSSSSALKLISVPETVNTVSSTLFSARRYPFNPIFSIARALQPAVFSDIRKMMLRADGKRRLLPPELLRRNDMEPVSCLLQNAAVPAAVICKEMRILFFGIPPHDTDSKLYSGTVFDPRPCFDFLYGRKETEEYTAVMEMIRADDSGWHDAAAERHCDLEIRFGNVPASPALCFEVGIAVCEKLPEAPGPDGLIHTVFRLFGAYLFFPALRRVRHKGSDWWIYSRNYLTGRAECPYNREDVGVFDRNGLVTDRKTSEDVYAKYRFLSLL